MWCVCVCDCACVCVADSLDKDAQRTIWKVFAYSWLAPIWSVAKIINIFWMNVSVVLSLLHLGLIISPHNFFSFPSVKHLNAMAVAMQKRKEKKKKKKKKPFRCGKDHQVCRSSYSAVLLLLLLLLLLVLQLLLLCVWVHIHACI